MTANANELSNAARFVAQLERLERGPLAQLRRGLGGDERSVYWLEGLYIRTGYTSLTEGQRRILQLVAGLYALKPQPKDDGDDSEATDEAEATANAANAPSIGQLMGRLYVKQGARPSTERRFLALLDADRDGLNYQMRQAVMLLGTEEITPDWVRLTEDLLYWGDDVRRRWARDFYSEIYRETPQDKAKTNSPADQEPTTSTAPLPNAPTENDDEGETL
ncbi:type I-E CRISPR-associated protein Cse2/CasB [Deinococcus lacus]|uniref:Type I-E CRISPR-associated protein Cse2/CasB n=1 Tax=Deinococcus lacus TaxID=392561 RepID=A0ABW1YFP8_9DEIO